MNGTCFDVQSTIGQQYRRQKNIRVRSWETEEDWKSIIWVPLYTPADSFILLCACVYWKDFCLSGATQLCVDLLCCKAVKVLQLPLCGQTPAIVSGLVKSRQVCSAGWSAWKDIKRVWIQRTEEEDGKLGACWWSKRYNIHPVTLFSVLGNNYIF